MEESLPEIVEIMQAVSDVSQALIDKMNAIQSEIAASDARGAGAAGRLALAARFSRELDAAADQMEVLAARYEDHMRSIDPGVGVILSDLEGDPSREQGDVIEFLNGLVELGPTFSRFVEVTTENGVNIQLSGDSDLAHKLDQSGISA